ncbi:V-set and immunoglobulin domain-containing protein 1-like [Chelmon rostratus]|uniref:V-set and immunoglobulin domain-containing protein 1-like n=1 Tax=Chelmon rostratus TaxID=109905 RepID=UPI001BE8BAFB|nr:V-set and immunoglobulin domain-containing protein 1-like [Chelmon rostratus]
MNVIHSPDSTGISQNELRLNVFYPATRFLTRPSGTKMIFCYIFFVVSLMGILHDPRVSSCGGKCTDNPVFTPSSLVVKFGDPASARCSVCQRCQSKAFGLEKSLGESTENGTTVFWTVDRMTEWGTSAICYYNDEDTGCQCSNSLHVTVYQPPDSVSISFANHSGPVFAGRQYALQCTVQGVAVVENLVVTFYSGQTALGQQKSKNKGKKPVNESFTFTITPSEKDDGVQYWCDAKLELGPEGPQLPPVVMSQNMTAVVHYKPQLRTSSHPDPIIITEGNPLQLNCTAVGNPSPLYTWLLPSDVLSTHSGSILTFDSIKTTDKGRYTCSVSNAMDTVTVTFNVDVRANYIGLIIAGIALAVAVIFILVIYVCVRHYKRNKMGQYNLKDVFRLHTRHLAVPSSE